MLKRVITYHYNGNIREEYYVDSSRMKQGEYKEYYDNGKPNIICNYVNNKLHGDYKEYYQNGQLRGICNFVDDKIHGEYKSYYLNGQLDIICNYVNNNLHGEYKYYYQNGKLHVICNFVYDKRQGEYKAYHDNGKLVKYSFYINGNEVDVSIHGMDINNLTEDDMNLLTVIYA